MKLLLRITAWRRLGNAVGTWANSDIDFLQLLALLISPITVCCASTVLADDTNAPAKVGITLEAPLDYQVFQRHSRIEGIVAVVGTIKLNTSDIPLPDVLDTRMTRKDPTGDLPGTWQPVSFDPKTGSFRGKITVSAGGWYRFELRASRKGIELSRASVEHVGVGEVFVIAGQSNSANYGEERQTTQSGFVAAFDGSSWRPANDPQPGAGGTRGSFIPPFGDALNSRLGVPIGIVAMGIGSTSVREWLPPGTRLTRLPTITRNVITNHAGQWEAAGHIFTKFANRMKQLGPRGFRAVLWHQGESDANQADPQCTLPGDQYRDALETLIRATRKEAGWEIPWFVAQASYHSPDDPGSPDIRAAQKALWDSGVALEGPDTDKLTGDLREKAGRGVHLSAKGLREHGRLWAEKVGPWIETQAVR
jgi:hypothetical protein